MDGVNKFGGPAPSDCLVKYDNPKILSEKFPSVAATKSPRKIADTSQAVQPDEFDIVLPSTPAKPNRPDKYPNVNRLSTTDEILDYILPPRLWVENGQHYSQRVSRVPATRTDILNLQEKLDRRLEELQAQETGIDPIRRELYTQAFDELIRQATLECAERGLMLLRVRDEIQMTLAAYQTLFESSMAYGMRKVLLAEQAKDDCTSTATRLTEKQDDLKGQLQEWERKCEELEQKNKELMQEDTQRKFEELAAVKRTNNQLATVLDNIILQRTLVFNTNSGTSDIAAENTGKPMDVDQDATNEESSGPDGSKSKSAV